MTELTESERNRFVNEIRRFRLAASDMKQVAGAAETLGAIKLNEAAARVMHTGLVVAYVRPFRSQGIGSLDEVEWAPTAPRDRAFHNMLVFLRNKVYAHTDRTPYRDIEDTSALLSLEGGPTYAESYVLLNKDGIARLGGIAVAQGGRFSDAADECEVSLGRVPSLYEALGRIPAEEWERLQRSFES